MMVLLLVAVRHCCLPLVPTLGSCWPLVGAPSYAMSSRLAALAAIAAAAVMPRALVCLHHMVHSKFQQQQRQSQQQYHP